MSKQLIIDTKVFELNFIHSVCGIGPCMLLLCCSSFILRASFSQTCGMKRYYIW